MYGIFTNIYPINEPNVGKYTIHGASGYIYIHIHIYITHNDDVKQEILAVLSSGKINQAAKQSFSPAALL